MRKGENIKFRNRSSVRKFDGNVFGAWLDVSMSSLLQRVVTGSIDNDGEQYCPRSTSGDFVGATGSQRLPDHIDTFLEVKGFEWLGARADGLSDG